MRFLRNWYDFSLLMADEDWWTEERKFLFRYGIVTGLICGVLIGVALLMFILAWSL